MRFKEVVILENERLGEYEGRIWIHDKDLAREAKPGQFAMLSVGGLSNPFLPRAISINRVVGEKVAFAYQEVGEGTRLLGKLVEGNTLKILGPLGNGFDLSPRDSHLMLIGGGIGRAPIEWLTEVLYSKGNKITLVLGAKTKEGLGGLLDTRHLDGVTLHLLTEDGSIGQKGLVTDLVAHADQVDCFYACGPTPMMEAIKHIAQKKNIPLQISLEGKMACGVGVCLGCTCNSKTTDHYHKVCKDGPVFWAEEVDLSW